MYSGFKPQSGQTKDYKIGICCFYAKHAAERRKNKDWLARNQNNVSEVLSPFCCVLSVEATNTNFVVFGLTRLGLEPTIFRTRGEYANDYTTDAVSPAHKIANVEQSLEEILQRLFGSESG
jgi:hypothetical protein